MVKGKGGMAAPKRAKSEDIDFTVKPGDPDVVVQCLTLVMPQDLRSFINSMQKDNVEAFYTNVMGQKNSDRIFRLYLDEITQLRTVQAGNKKRVGIQSQGFGWD